METCLREEIAKDGFAIIEALRWRYRLGVRTEDSQSSNPGSIPGSATKSLVLSAAMETPSPEALRIVEYQRSFYRLALQEIVVCRTPRKLATMEPDFTEQVFDASTRRKWLPLYVGCCSYKYRRHVAIVTAQQDEKGPVISQALLIQSRLEFLRANWTKIGSP